MSEQQIQRIIKRVQAEALFSEKSGYVLETLRRVLRKELADPPDPVARINRYYDKAFQR